ncbi:MAG: hypothetical protein GVX96_06860 [Bacteroidetes bacterium]|jgi:hypothetical protein|nr:hypothetical protein [Bacteroidota bacterium]
MSRKIDQFFKSKVSEHAESFRREDWLAFNSILDETKMERRFGFLFWTVMLFLILSFLFFIPGSNPFGSENPVLRDIGSESTSRSSLEVVQLDNNTISDLHSTAQNSKSDFFDSRKLPFARQVVPAFSKYRDVSSTFYESAANANQTMAGSTETSQRMPGLKNRLADELILDETVLYEPVQLNRQPGLTSLSSGVNSNSFSIDKIPAVNYNTPAHFSYGIGMLLGDFSLTDAGLFLSLSYPLSNHMTLMARPGVMYSTSGQVKARYYHQYYDFGLNEKEIEINRRGHLQMEVPVFLAIRNSRHQLGIGGGFQWSLWERFSKKEVLKSDKELVAGETSGVNVVRSKGWKSSGLGSTSFLEGFYQYQLSPSLQLGLRSRWLFSSQHREDQTEAGTFRYGLILTYTLK